MIAQHFLDNTTSFHLKIYVEKEQTKGDPSRNAAVRNTSSVIWGLPLIRRVFCSALLKVCILPSTNPFDFGYI